MSMQSYARELFRSGRFRKELAEFVSIPSVSQLPENLSDVYEASSFVESYLSGLGASTRIVKAGEYPLLTATIEGRKGAPTVAIYGHVDVQPWKNQNWRSNPTVLTEHDGKWVARGIVDNKGPLLAEIIAVEGAIANGSGLTYQFVIEAQEEVGSRDFPQGLAQVSDELRPDSIFVADGNWIDGERPAITTSLRGLLHLRFSYRSGERDLHAGTWGNFAENAMETLDLTLIHLGNAIRNNVIYVTPSIDRSTLYSYPLSVDDMAKQSGIRRSRCPTYDVIHTNFGRWYRPSFEMVDRSGGSGSSSIPGSAWVDVNLRVPPLVDPDKVYGEVVRLARAHNPDIEVENHGTLKPFITSAKGPHMDTALKSFERGFGKKVFLTGEGASIGAIPTLQEAFPGKEIILTGLTVPGVMHGENEYADPEVLEQGVAAFGDYFLEIEKIKK